MPVTSKIRPRRKRSANAGSRWLRTLQEICATAALVALRMLMNSIAEAFPKIAKRLARQQLDGKPRKPDAV